MKSLITSSLLLLALLLPATAAAYDFEVDGIYYNINGNEATVTYGNDIWVSGSYNEDVNIPDKVTYNGKTYSVTAIGSYAFWCSSGLMSVTIPNSVTTIDHDAFYGCTSLTSVNIPNSVTSIGYSAFSYCSELTNMTLPNSITSINSCTFQGCSGLTSVSIPNSVTSIGGGAFAYCSGLTNIVVESGNTTYDSRNNCNAIIETASNTLIAGSQNTVILNSVTAIGYRAFAGCSNMTRVVIPNSVTSIDGFAFYDCYGLTSMTIPNSVTYIGNATFHGCYGLTSLTIPNSVTQIAPIAFTNCNSLTDVYSFITNPSEVAMWEDLFCVWLQEGDFDYSSRTLHVPQGAISAYQASANWYPFFGQIVEDLMTGDVNCDLEVNIADINAAIGQILSGNYTALGDVNGDGEVNIADINTVIDIILGN